MDPSIQMQDSQPQPSSVVTSDGIGGPTSSHHDEFSKQPKVEGVTSEEKAQPAVQFDDKRKPVIPDEGHENDNTAEYNVKDDTDSADAAVTQAPKKKKKKKKSKSQKTAALGTGFEEYFVDTPLKPSEFEVEKGLYHGSLPFAQRIETAIQRFAARRNMNPAKRKVFDKYLAIGGVSAGPKMFQGAGLDLQTLEDGDAQDIALLTATNFVAFDATDPRNGLYVVDFERCMKSFLSNTLTTFDLQGEAEFKSTIHVIRNFLNYLLHHDVCPEFADSIKECKRLCDVGERELWTIAQISRDLPGAFNTACCKIFGGVFEAVNIEIASCWMSKEEIAKAKDQMTRVGAVKAFKLAIVANASEEQLKQFKVQCKAKTIHVTSIETVSMEVVEVIHSSQEIQDLYDGMGDSNSVGKLITKSWQSPNTAPIDLTEEEEAELAKTPKPTKSYELWVEDDLLRNFFPGMKIDEVRVHHLSIGVSYFDEIFGIHCSFYDVTANNALLGWREPEGEGNWLPYKKRGGGNDEDHQYEVGSDGDIMEKFVPEEAEQGAQHEAGDRDSSSHLANQEVDKEASPNTIIPNDNLTAPPQQTSNAYSFTLPIHQHPNANQTEPTNLPPPNTTSNPPQDNKANAAAPITTTSTIAGAPTTAETSTTELPVRKEITMKRTPKDSRL